MHDDIETTEPGPANADDVLPSAESKEPSLAEITALIASLRNAIGDLASRMNGTEHWISWLVHNLNQVGLVVRHHATSSEDQLRDIVELLVLKQVISPTCVEVCATQGLAITSHDHVFPRGTRTDNTRYPRFVRAAERVVGNPVHHLDLGCAGGGLVWEFSLRGHLSIGIEGSDYSQRHARAEWRVLNDRLFTADITKPFTVKKEGATVLFSLITAWEVLEHIAAQDLPALLSNVTKHLKPEGLFVCSIATFEDQDAVIGAVWHKTVQTRMFWEQAIRDSGLIPVASPFVTEDYPRGSGNERVPDWHADLEPHKGFHLVCMRA